jgi:LCP family protein required for cell wall assembly
VSRLAQSSRLWEQLDVQIARKELDLDQATNTVLNVLVVGSDSRAQLTSRRDVERFGQNVGQRADTMMLCQIDVSGERGAIFSLPRDLWVPAPDNGQRPPHGLAKLGDVYGRGAQNLIEAVRRLTQLPIHHYVEVEMSGFHRLIEAVGGIRVRIEDHFYDPVLRFWLPPGTHTLDGDRALSYVRARNATSGYDEDRIKRQQEFVRALLAQVGRPRVLAHPFRFRELAHAAVQSLTVDSGLRLQDLAAIALKLRRVDSDRLVTCAPPIREKEIDGRVGAEIDGTAHEPFLARLRAPFVGAEPARQALVPTPAASTITPTGGVALTFDDGPHPTFTPRIMDILEARGVRGTFFLIGRQAQKHPDLVRSIASRGHTVGGHTWSHRILTTISDADWYFEVEYTNELLRELSGQSVPYIRPPQGKQDARTLGKLRAAGLVSVRWTKDTEDWTNPGADVIVRRAVGGLRPGAVVLMHDGGGNRDQTVDALERILDGIAGAGLEVQPLALMYRRFTA